ncbi:class I SAM-dependent methyltransferase [Phytomonospora sp. NPDC050363]|uniref:class I SAM-dependent methyltransferase n=1 Tax=Phytomonospora sp. NPDC050363 TaxID=3155642 RepID=UPI003400CFBB
MTDAYRDPRLAATYDPLNRWGPGDDFYLGHVMGAASVLDIGCGTGELLSRARREGHTGDLAGVDPAPAMLAAAKAKRSDVAWYAGDARTLDLSRRFELILMTGHAFQALLDDDDVRAALDRFARHLVWGGTLAFETRDPAAKAWEHWTPAETSTRVRSALGEDFTVSHELLGTREPDLVDFRTAYRSHDTDESFTDDGTLRFIDPEHLAKLVAASGFVVENRYGDWDRRPWTAGSPEIVTVATLA